jgi:oxygen-dependent protoporphyrinogen oxidase
MNQFDALVIGAGPAGLAAAFALSKAGLKIQLLEASDHAGGKAWSERFEGYLVETGPHTFRGQSKHILSLIEELGLNSQLLAVDAAKARFIFRAGRLHRLPARGLEFLSTPLLSRRAKVSTLFGLLRRGRDGERSVADWFTRRFGSEFHRILVQPMVGGIFAGDSAELDMQRAFPNLWQQTGARGRLLPALLRSRKGQRRGVFMLQGGFAQLAEAMTERLNGCLRTQQRVVSIGVKSAGVYRVDCASGESFESAKLVLATPLAGLKHLLPDLLPGTKLCLEGLVSASMISVSLGGPGKSPLPAGFGALIPRSEGLRMLGVINVSALSAERSPKDHWLATLYFGGTGDAEIINLDDSCLLTLAELELEKLCSTPFQPLFRRVVRHTNAIPQPDLNSSRALAILGQQIANAPGLHLAGSYLGGVSLDAAIASGFEAAAAVQKELAA